MEENRQVVTENRQSLEGRLDGLGQNHQQVILQLRSLDERYESYNSRVDRYLSMGELPPCGGNPSPTFNILVDQAPMHEAGQPPPIPMARPYVAPANVGGGVGLSGGDHIHHMLIQDLCHPSSMGKAWTKWGSCRQGGQQGGYGHDVNALREQVAQLLNEQLGLGVRTTMPPVYRKPYPEWVDRHYPFPRGFRVPDFATFTGMGDQSTVEHIGRFTVQCGDVGDFVKLRIFGNSLTGAAFAWYVNLPSNSIQTWQ
ncbi:hypothetical protein LINGRAHAP2_LOCUS2015 [Linum grandiflorum]